MYVTILYSSEIIARFVTLHALKSFSDIVRLEPAGKRYERNLLKRACEGEMTITVVGSEMKKIAEQASNRIDCGTIKVVLNAFSFPSNEPEPFDIRKKYSLPQDSKVILCVGNVSRRKNQGQLINAFNLIDEQIAYQTYIFFLGNNKEPDYTIDILKENCRMADHIIYCGVVDKECVSNYYKQANGVALLSLSEAFGLSLVEGMHFGLPCMAFTDMDAFSDLYSPSVMVGVKDHTDKSVAKGLTELLSKQWDYNIIKQFSKKFETDIMRKNYIKIYNELVG